MQSDNDKRNTSWFQISCWAMSSHSDLGFGRHGVVHGKLPRPAARDGVEHAPVPLVEAADVGLHADLAVRVRQQALDGDEHLGDRQACKTTWFMIEGE